MVLFRYIVEKRELNDSWTLLLTILDLKEENFGDYNCTVFNHAGNDTATVSLMQSMCKYEQKTEKKLKKYKLKLIKSKLNSLNVYMFLGGSMDKHVEQND